MKHKPQRGYAILVYRHASLCDCQYINKRFSRIRTFTDLIQNLFADLIQYLFAFVANRSNSFALCLIENLQGASKGFFTKVTLESHLISLQYLPSVSKFTNEPQVIVRGG